LTLKDHPNKLVQHVHRVYQVHDISKSSKRPKKNQIETQNRHPNKTRQNPSIKTNASKLLPSMVLKNSINQTLLGYYRGQK
jgi:hypothetical protein